MVQIVRDFIKRDFVKNLLISLTGNGLAQLITTLSLFIIVRFYTPEQFGEYALYMSIVNILMVISSGRYDLAIMLPEQEKRAKNIFQLSFIILLLYTLIIALIIVVFHKAIVLKLSFSNPWLILFVPWSVFVMGGIRILSQYFSRSKEFKKLSFSKVYQSGTTSGLNISLGSLTNIGVWGLLIGHLAGQSLLFFILLKSKVRYLLEGFSKENIQSCSKEYINFPLFSLPMGLLNGISMDVILYFLNAYFSTAIVGFYSNAFKVVNYPLHILAMSFSGVFYQRISKSETPGKLYLQFFLGNLGLALFLLWPFIFWGEPIFSFLFGADWARSGELVGYIIPIAAISFASRTVVSVFSLRKKNQVLLIWQAIFLVTIIITIILNKADIVNLLKAYNLIGCILYLVLVVMGIQIAKRN